MITGEGKIAVLVYHEDHPEAYAPEISEATGVDYLDVIHTLREAAAAKPTFKIESKDLIYEDKNTVALVAKLLEKASGGLIKFEVVDVTPCASKVNHGPGHQSKTYCELTGPHETHGATIMGSWEEWDEDGEYI